MERFIKDLRAIGKTISDIAEKYITSHLKILIPPYPQIRPFKVR